MDVFINLYGKLNRASLPLRFGFSLSQSHQSFATLDDEVFDPVGTNRQRGDEINQGRKHFLGTLPGGLYAALILVMIVIFLLGFFLDYIEIIFVIVPLVGPILIANGADPLWLGILISLNLQTSFLTPPFGFSLFFLRGVAPSSIKTRNMYRGVIPFIGIQVLAILIVGFYPEIATWLPNKMF